MNPVLELVLVRLEQELEAFQPISEAEAVSKANLVQAEEFFTLLANQRAFHDREAVFERGRFRFSVEAFPDSRPSPHDQVS